MARLKITAWNTIGSQRVGLSYGRFALMMLVITIAIFSLTYLNVFEAAHIEFSQMRLWRSLVVAAVVSLVVLAFAGSSCRSRRARFAIPLVAIAAMLPAFWLLRSERTVGDVAYLKAMIPNHSVGILASSRARIHDERVRRLADAIRERQLREIEKMKLLIASLESESSGVTPISSSTALNR